MASSHAAALVDYDRALKLLADSAKINRSDRMTPDYTGNTLMGKGMSLAALNKPGEAAPVFARHCKEHR